MTQDENKLSERTEMSQDEMLSSILKNLSPPSGGSASPTAPQNQTGDIISSLLSNPELIAKLPTVISSVKPILDMLGMGTAAPTAVPVSAPSAQSAPAPPTVKQDKHSDSRTALLYAMKPYLSPERQNAIDYIVKLGRLGDILKTL